MMNSHTSSIHSNTGDTPVSGTPMVQEYHPDGTVSVSVADAYALHKKEQRKHDTKRALQRLPTFALLLAIMTITPVVLIKATVKEPAPANKPSTAVATTDATR